jgi:glycine/D-amino acid oxidase-like deaminating enzyme
MSLDGLPYIGRYSAATGNLFVATGFNKWGMTGSMLASMVLRDLLTGRESPVAALLDPSRSMLHPQLLVNGLESAWNLLRPTRPRCPHMGCALKWNSHERSWDCSCHGSRFAEDGHLLNEPAQRNLHQH